MTVGDASTILHEDSTDHMRHCIIIRWLAFSLDFTAEATTDWWDEWIKGKFGWLHRIYVAGNGKEGKRRVLYLPEECHAKEMIRWIGMLYTIYNITKYGKSPRDLEELRAMPHHILDDMEERRSRLKKRIRPRVEGDG